VFDKVRVDLGNSPKIVNVSDVFPVTYKDVTAPGRCHTRVRQFRGAKSLNTQKRASGSDGVFKDQAAEHTTAVMYIITYVSIP
jgi:hypothetical protein